MYLKATGALLDLAWLTGSASCKVLRHRLFGNSDIGKHESWRCRHRHRRCTRCLASRCRQSRRRHLQRPAISERHFKKVRTCTLIVIPYCPAHEIISIRAVVLSTLFSRFLRNIESALTKMFGKLLPGSNIKDLSSEDIATLCSAIKNICPQMSNSAAQGLCLLTIE